MYDFVKLKGIFEYNLIIYVYILVEVGKCVFVDRVEYLGDLDFYEVLKIVLFVDDYFVKWVSIICLDVILIIENIKFGLYESE